MTPAVWEEAIDRQTWDHVRSVLLNPERLTLRNTPTKYLLTGLIFCGVCRGPLLSRPRDAHTKRIRLREALRPLESATLGSTRA